MTEMVITDVRACVCCLRAQVLLRTVEGTRSVVLPVDYAVAIHLQVGNDRTVGGASRLLMDSLLRACAEKEITLRRVVLDTAPKTILVGKVVFERNTLEETCLCSPSEALMLAARARMPVLVTDAVLSGRPAVKRCGLSAAHRSEYGVVSH